MSWSRILWSFSLALVAGCHFDPYGLGPGAGGATDGRVADATVAPDRGALTPDTALVEVDAELPDASPPDAPACPSTYVASGGSSYRAVSTTRSWLDAERECEAEGTHLVVIDDNEESRRVGDLSSANEFWVGLSDRVTENAWHTVTGRNASFLPWAPGEPNDVAGEDCGVHLNNNKINDADCTDLSRAFVCECDGQQAVPTAF